MRILKFGGASVKDAEGVRNLLNILQDIDDNDLLVVISAMGKMTNAFEEIVDSYFYNKQDLNAKLDQVIDFHNNIIIDLFEDHDHPVFEELRILYKNLQEFLLKNESRDFNYLYDQIVSNAELISTKICSAYLHKMGLSNIWMDVRDCIKTNSDHRRAKVDWDRTCKLINSKINKSKIYVTQGFIASDAKDQTTTLGREGSDYTAGIFAYCLDADHVTIFKDVEGVLNADPRYFKKTILLKQISYREAIELAFYGASVIHPKTLQPLQRKEIPLNIRSFSKPNDAGTAVGKGIHLKPETPCFIVKKDQILLSLSTKDFSFIMEDDISEIFDYFHQYKMKVNLIQNSAISFSVCIEDNFENFRELHRHLKLKYICLYNKNVSLFTIRHFNSGSVDEIQQNKEILLKQLSRETLQVIVKN